MTSFCFLHLPRSQNGQAMTRNNAIFRIHSLALKPKASLAATMRRGDAAAVSPRSVVRGHGRRFACIKCSTIRVRLTSGANQANIYMFRIRGRTGFDFADTPEAACRGRFVGLVNHSNQKITANEELALAA